MPSDPRPWRRYLRFSSIGIELGLSVMIGLIGGQWLDRQFGTDPWLLLLGLLLGMAAGFLGILRSVRALNAESAAAQTGAPSNPSGTPGPKA